MRRSCVPSALPHGPQSPCRGFHATHSSPLFIVYGRRGNLQTGVEDQSHNSLRFHFGRRDCRSSMWLSCSGPLRWRGTEWSRAPTSGKRTPAVKAQGKAEEGSADTPRGIHRLLCTLEKSTSRHWIWGCASEKKEETKGMRDAQGRATPRRDTIPFTNVCGASENFSPYNGSDLDVKGQDLTSSSRFEP